VKTRDVRDGLCLPKEQPRPKDQPSTNLPTGWMWRCGNVSRMSTYIRSSRKIVSSRRITIPECLPLRHREQRGQGTREEQPSTAVNLITAAGRISKHQDVSKTLLIVLTMMIYTNATNCPPLRQHQDQWGQEIRRFMGLMMCFLIPMRKLSQTQLQYCRKRWNKCRQGFKF